ncbi:MAG: DUF5663 domain-containing protein [Candidatus Magasanikbacteria bacterium]
MSKLPIKNKVEDLLNLDSLSEKRRKQVLTTAVKLIDLRSLNRILKDLTQDQRDQLSNLINNKSPERVRNFIKQKGFNLEQIVEEETKKAEKKFEQNLEYYNKKQ